MSTTIIYRLGREPGELGKTRNAWRGAMYVWNDIAKRYFDMESFPMYDKAAQKKVWNAQHHAVLPQHEIIVLMTTMDFAVVRGRDVQIVADAFEKYAKEHQNCSLAEQAAILRTADIRPDDLIGWQQTSVSEFWGRGWDKKSDEVTWYDTKENKHFDAYARSAFVTRLPVKGSQLPVLGN